MAFKNIQSKSTSEMIIDQIKNEIKNGNLKSGEKLPSERELCKMFSVSRTSVREGIKALSASGYLNVIQGKGAYVTENAIKYDEISNLLTNISDYSLKSLMEVRRMMEGEFARLAALRATPEEIEGIFQSAREIEKAKDINDFIIKDREFHYKIALATHNPLMNTLMKVFGEMLYKETNKITQVTAKTQTESLKISNEIAIAIKNRDSTKAKDLMIKHIKVLEDSMD